MSVNKSWAYLHPVGPEKITAWAITQERKKYGGRPLRGEYWSTHKPPHRKPMIQRQLNGGATTFFVYKHGEDAASGDGGESLTHRLLKEAIASLSGTTLKLGSHGEHPITITHGEMEREILTPEGPFRADAYLRFTSQSLLGLKWSGELYIEVHHTHAVPPDKQKSLRAARIPVVEVPVLKLFEYPYADEDTSDPREELHVRRLQNMLQKGFLIGNVISNPSSLEYLEMQLPKLRQDLASAEKNNAHATALLAEVSSEKAALRDTIAALTRQHNEAQTGMQIMGNQITERTARIAELTQLLADAESDKNDLKGELRSTTRAYWACLALLAGTLGLCLFLLFGRTVAGE